MSQIDRDESWARAYRMRSAFFRALAARADAVAISTEPSAAMRRITDALTAAEARKVAEHPDLAELNVQLDGYYGSVSTPPMT